MCPDLMFRTFNWILHPPNQGTLCSTLCGYYLPPPVVRVGESTHHDREPHLEFRCCVSRHTSSPCRGSSFSPPAEEQAAALPTPSGGSVFRCLLPSSHCCPPESAKSSPTHSFSSQLLELFCSCLLSYLLCPCGFMPFFFFLITIMLEDFGALRDKRMCSVGWDLTKVIPFFFFFLS